MPMERIWVLWVLFTAVVAAELGRASWCLEKERVGLEELWKSIAPVEVAPPPRESDCCLWDGVNCSASTGRVQRLDFSSFAGHSPSLGYAGYFLNVSLLLPFLDLLELNLGSRSFAGLIPNWGFHGLINQQDFIKLTRLETLSIFRSNMSSVVSLEVFGSLKYLTLYNSELTITNLEGICELKNIVELHLTDNAIRGHLPPCIGNLTHLQALDLSFNQINGNIPSTIANLSHLSHLNLAGNYWSGSFSLHFLANNSKLQNLSLYSMDNDFQVETETHSWFPSFQLEHLLLYNCNLNKMSDSVIPTFLLHQSELITIHLPNNKLRDTFPSWLLQNNSKLQTFWMSNNYLTGNLILPNFVHHFLVDMWVSNNKIEGLLPDNLGALLPSLEILVLSTNEFQGTLPSSFGAINYLHYVDLSFNSFSGVLPKSLFANNSYLDGIDLSNNVLDGEISLNLTTLPQLRYLFLSNNKFSGIIEDLPSQSSSNLEVFDISNNLISAKLSNLIANFSSLQVLILSNNSFVGEIPDKLCHLNKLDHLDLSHNNLFGSIPSCLTTLPLQFLYMRSSNLSGAIPDGVSMNASLVDLDLSYNHFSSTVLPNWIYSLHDLQILLMAGLQLEGQISAHLCGLQKIKIIDFSHNNLNGFIPSCIFKMPYYRVVESPYDPFVPASHSLSGISPSQDKLFGVEFTTKSSSIGFKGGILNFMSGLDLSSNKLSGHIPPQIGYAEAIRSLNLSNNRLWGSMPSNISRLKEIESLDLSSNNLSGEIPSQIARLNFLSTFNVSNNNLSGPIPNGGQFSNFDEQNYGGNEFLCGPQLRRHCTPSSPPSSTPPDEEQEEKDDERWFFWLSFIAAYVPVFVSVVVVVGMDTRCTRLWFAAVDVVCSKLLCVFAKLKFILGIN